MILKTQEDILYICYEREVQYLWEHIFKWKWMWNSGENETMRASIYKLTCLYIIIRRFLLKMTKFYLDINIKIINWKRRKNNILNI